MFKHLRRAVMALAVGAVATVAVAWLCAGWSPTRSISDPFLHPTTALETTDPEGATGLHYVQSGLGWNFICLAGNRFWTEGKPEIVWMGSYEGTYHQIAGWPLRAVRSRVSVLDIPVANRPTESDFDPQPPPPQKRGWNLPLDEILHRGMATTDLPAWLHAQPNRRLPLYPLTLGFLVDTLFFAGVYLLLRTFIARAWRRWRSASRALPAVDPALDTTP